LTIIFYFYTKQSLIITEMFGNL